MRGRGEARNEPGRWTRSGGRWLLLILFLLLICASAHAQKTRVILVSGFTVTDLRPKSEHGIHVFPSSGALAMLQPFGKEELVVLGERLEIKQTGNFEERGGREILKPLAEQANRGEIRLIVVCDEPPKDKLGFVVVIGPGIPHSSVLASPSTRAEGLVTAADIVALVRGESRAAYVVKTETNAWQTVWYWSNKIEGIRATKNVVLVTYGTLVGILLGVLFWRVRKQKSTEGFSSGIAVAAGGTIGLTLIPAIMFPPLLSFSLVSMGSALLCQWKLKRVLLVLVGLIFLDTILGWKLVAQSPLSDYYIPGIRFYGIGNEYMGLLIGAALMSVPKRFLGWVGVGIVLLLGLPMLGANAGGAMAATVAFFPPSKKFWWRVALPFVVVAALAGLDRWMPGAAQSHIGQAAGKGPSAWGEIIIRKLAMNARLTVAGPTLLALVVAGIGVWQLKSLFARLDSELQSRVVQALWGAGAAIAFNDSGTVAALLLLAPVIVVCLEQALRLTES